MKYDSTVEATDSLGDRERAEFKFEVNGKAFKVMLDDLYSNKIRGVARELCSNAVDAQIEASEKRPFDVYLPTSMYPEFRIRDYGTGLPHEDVMTMYVTLFRSTKDQSNEATGSFGLGSKIPFAYGDAFTVTSYFNGEKRTYSANMGDRGVPVIAYIDELTGSTDEPNGLEVTVSIRDSDYQEFADELAHLSLAFEPKPNVIGGSYQPVVPEWISRNGRVQVIPRRYYNSLFCIKQGSAIYPVDDYRSYRAAGDKVKDDYNHTIVVDVPIGTVAISPNREALSIDDIARDTLSSELFDAMTSVSEEISEILEDCSSRLEVLNAYTKVLKFLTTSSSIDLSTHSKDGDWKPTNTIMLSGGSDWEVLRGRGGTSRDATKLNAFSYEGASSLLFVISYTDRPVQREVTRYRALIREIEENRGDQRQVFLLKDPTPRQIERLYTLLGLSREQIVTTASLPDPGPPTRVKREDNVITGVRIHSSSEYTPDEVKKLPGEYYWYELGRYKNLAQRRSTTRRLQAHVSNGFIKEEIPVLAFTKSAVKRLQPSEAMRVETAAGAAKLKLRDKIVAAKLRGKLLGAIGDERIWEKLGVEVPARDGNSNLRYMDDIAATVEAEEQYRALVAEPEKKFPLLFGSFAFVDMVCYIDDRNNSTEGNPS